MEMLAERLHDAYSSTSHQRFASDQFEILDTKRRVTARYTHLLQTSRHEVLHLVMPPYVTVLEATPHRLNIQAAAIRRGVRFRSIYDSDTFTDDMSLYTAQQGVAIGGEIRLSGGLPMKLVLFDGTSAIMPLREDDPAQGSLLVHSPTLLYVLTALFESLWEHGVPWRNGSARPPSAPPGRDRPDERTREILRLMSLGMKDEAIARVMGLSRMDDPEAHHRHRRRAGSQNALPDRAVGAGTRMAAATAESSSLPSPPVPPAVPGHGRSARCSGPPAQHADAG